jgi:protein SHQ1
MDSVESHPLDDQKKQGEQRRKAIQTDSSLLDLENQHSIEQVNIINRKPKYGFNNSYSNFFKCWHGELSEIVALPDPDGTPIHQRSCIREAAEDAHFDVERYLMDFCNEQEDIYYNTAMKFEPFWNNFPQVHLYDKAPKKMICPMKKCEPEVETSISDICKSLNKLELGQDLAKEAVIAFSDEDQELLRRLPHKEYLIKPDSSEEDHVLGGLLDILIGFTYDHLISEGDHGIESAWTISTLSPTLSWLDTSSSTKSIVRTAVRRMLSYPFLRQYDLAIHVMNMTNSILKCGKRAVLRVLLQIYRIFEKSETQYLLNSLYVQDYCVWIQTIEDSLLLNLSSVFSSSISSFSKEQTGWALIEMEAILEDSSVSDSEDESDESDQSNESED